MFKYSVIGDNTPENRDHLEGLGYNDNLQLKHPDSNIVITSDMLTEYAKFYTKSVEKVKIAYPELVVCTNNPDLFKAVTAIRDDSDYMQLFTNGKEWILCDREDWIDMYSVLCCGGNFNYNKNGELDAFHKASLAELQEHFNNEKRNQ